MAPRAKFTGTGMFVPDRVVTNEDLTKLMDTSDEWIRQRSGVGERRYIEEGQTPGSLAQKASERALETAGLEPADIDCIVLATLSAHADFPGTAFFLHELLEVPEIPCFDLRAQCSGFVYSLGIAKSLIEARQFQRVLVVGCEVHSTGLDLSDEGRDVAVLFGDGAGAVVLELNENASDAAGLIEVRLHAQGRYAKKLWIEAPGSGFTPVRINHEMLDQGRHFPRMEGRFVFKHAVKRLPEVLLETLDAAGLELQDVDLFLFHQANLRINEYVAQQLEIPAEKCFHNIQRYGNCSAASIPMLLDEAVRGGLLEPGKLVAMTTFGSGFSWSCAVARW